MTEHQARERKVRMNDADVRLLKAARDEIDSSLALGAVARMGARRLLESEDDEPEVKF